MKAFIIIIIAICSAMPFRSRASHAAGGYFQYTCLSNNNYQVDYYFLRDCGGAPSPSSVPFTVRDYCGGVCLPTVNAPIVSTTLVDFGCGNACAGGSTQSGAPSYELVRYSANITLNTNCEEWEISTYISQRNTVDFSTNPVTSLNMYNYCVINNSVCNSSVEISGAPFAIGCVNGLGSSVYNINNTNGNQLNYNFTIPLNGSCNNQSGVSYVGGTSFNRPVPSVSDFVLDQANGEFDFAPTATGENYFTVKIEEYDANNNLLGIIRLEGIVFSSNTCEVEAINFSNWFGTNGTIFEVDRPDQIYCNTINIDASDPNVALDEVIVELDEYLTLSQLTYNPDGSATVEICANYPPELECVNVESEITIVAKAPGNDCIGLNAGVGDIKTYSIVKPPTPYCPEHLFFTNRNSISGVPMPNYAQAKQTIWVGDDMPNFAPPEVEGPVELVGNLELRAGNQIVLPSCQGGGTGCVTITGNTTLIVEDVNCSPDCAAPNISISCDKKMFCYGEQLTANLVGTPPYTIFWNVNGTTYTTTSYQNYNVLDIYQIAASLEGTIPYTITAFDATSQEVSCGGSFLGTKKFYNDIRQNTEYYDFTATPWLGESGYYYNGSVFISAVNQTMGTIYDGVNYDPNIPIDAPPYYGATYMEFIVFDGFGDQIHSQVESIEGGNDWSIDNFVFRWNGHLNNDVNEPCLATQSGDITFNYRLIAKNCLSSNVPNPPVQSPLPSPEEAHVENSIFIITDNCFDDQNLPIISAGRVSDQNSNDPKVLDSTTVEKLPLGGSLASTSTNQNLDRYETRESSVVVDSQITCHPNPTEGKFVLRGGVLDYYNVELTGIDGKSMRVVKYKMGEELNISHLSSGVYTVIVRSGLDFVQLFKLIKF